MDYQGSSHHYLLFIAFLYVWQMVQALPCLPVQPRYVYADGVIPILNIWSSGMPEVT